MYLKQAKNSNIWSPYITKKTKCKNIVFVTTSFWGLNAYVRKLNHVV